MSASKARTDSPSLPADTGPEADGARQEKGRRTLSSAALLGDAGEVLIDHRGEIYSLRETSRGKLILTK